MSNSPTPEEIKTLRENAGLTQTEAAKLVGSKLRSWQNWEAPANSSEYRRIKSSTWDLFKSKALPHKREKQSADVDALMQDPWIQGRTLAKYDSLVAFPTEETIDVWIDGWVAGCVDLGEYEIWRERLWQMCEHLQAPAFLKKRGKKPKLALDI